MSKSVKYYLAAYNLLAFIFWAAFIDIYIRHSIDNIGMWYVNTTTLILLNIAQGLAIMEIVHSLIRWVKSPVGSTVAQVASRLLVLGVIDYIVIKEPIDITADFAGDIFHFGFNIVAFAWTVTEWVRYSFYFLSLFNIQPRLLLWLRYTFFIVLYPCGVTGEWLILIAPAIAFTPPFAAYKFILIPIAISYVYYFPILYKYMWKQRRAKL